MKQFIVASLLFLCHYRAFSQDVWQWLNPQPSGSISLNITFTDRQHGFILNYNGDLMRTSDQGVHWQITDHFPTATCMAIVDSTGVITCSNGRLYISSDNGNTWSLAQSSLSLNLDNPVSIVSRDTFFLSGNNLYRSTDRGKTLTTLNAPFPAYSFSFLDSKTGFVINYQTLFKTTDGGQTWVNKDSVHYFRTIQFLNADTIFALGSGDTLLRTYDGGETWNTINIGATPQVMQFVNSKTGFTGDGVGEILRTDDGGTTWTSVTINKEARARYPINSLYFFDENTGFSVGRNGGISKTTNGGQTWSYYSPTYLPITAVSFPTAQTGYMCDWQNTFKTTDGGQHWDSLPLVTGSTFVQTHFSSADTGYFLSTNPVREHRTTDGGQTWNVFNPAGTDLAGAPGQFYFAPHSGFVSCGSQLLKTVDDGASWSTVWQAKDNSEYLNLIFFTDSQNGFATRGTQLMKTTDGGITWSLTYTNNRSLSGLWFFDPLNGYLVDTQPGGIGYVTHDGGISFSPQQFPQYFVGAMHTIGFFNRQIGYFTSDGNGDFGKGSYGHTYKTIDGGQTWQLSIDDVQGNSIIFTPDGKVVIAGNGGQLIESQIPPSLQISSLTATDDNACGEIFSVNVTATLSDADSISILYSGPDGRSDTVATTPGRVQNGSALCIASAKGFVPGGVYIARVRLQYNGVFQTSNLINFTPAGIPQPVIKDSTGYLVSSVDSANHWFRNGTAIPSAFGRIYYPNSSGSYSVQTIMDSCRSAMSDTVIIKLPDSSVNNPGPGLHIHPNPVLNQLVIDNQEGAPLEYVIISIVGNTILSGSSSDNQILINTRALPTGQYILRVRNHNTNSISSIMFLRS